MADIDNNGDLISEVTSHVRMNGDNDDDTGIAAGIEEHIDVDEEEMLRNALVGNGTFSEVQTLLSNGIQFINDATASSNGTGDQLQEKLVSDSPPVTFINESALQQAEESLSECTHSDQMDVEQSEALKQQSNTVVNPDFLPDSSEPEPLLICPQTLASSAPLGSSQNPIRIIQQGNQYTPVQQLSAEQLQQIMQVVHQQQLTKSAAAGSSVLFNPQTNTRIVYRVIYPSQLHKDESNMSDKTVSNFTPRRTYKKRNKEEEVERIEGPELTKEEKEQRKRMRQKTRSGRVSKPPKHMVKDFKHIHVLDYDEDYDDSDGGYSDFKYEEEAEETDAKDEDENFFVYAAGVDSVKPKNWKCITCEKAYIGRAGLARHLRLNPSHGSIDPDGDGDMEPPDPNVTPPVSVEENTSSMPATPNGINSTANSTGSFSEDSRDSSVSMTYTPAPQPRGRGRGRPPRGSLRGRGAYGRVDPEVRRINRLKEVSRECSDEELMEIVLPRLAKVITLWEFLLMKVKKGNPAWPHADDIYREYEKLHQHVKKLCQEYLQIITEPDHNVDQQKTVLQVENREVAHALGLQIGPHRVKDISDTDTELQYKYKVHSTASNTAGVDLSSRPAVKRPVELVSPSLMASPAKKAKPSPDKANFSTSGQHVNLINSSSPSKVITVMNCIATSGGSGTAKTAPFISKIKILSPSSGNNNTNQSTNSGTVSSGRTVSLLTDSFIKHPHSTVSISSLSSSCHSSAEKSTTTQLPQKLFTSGTNSVVQKSSFASSGSISLGYKTVQKTALNGTALSEDQSGNQPVTLSQNSPQNRLIVHDSASGTYTVCSVGNSFMTKSFSQESPSSSCNTTAVFSVPQDVKASLMQPKLVLNDMNTLNSLKDENDEFQQIITSVAGENIIARQILSKKTEDLAGVNPVATSSGPKIIDGEAESGGQKLILTLPNGEPLKIETNESDRTNNIVYALSNEDANQENVFFTVDPDSMLVTAYNGDQLLETVTEREKSSDAVNEGTGVLNSIHSSESVNESTDEVANGSTVRDSNAANPTDIADEIQLNGTLVDQSEAVKSSLRVQNEQTQMAAIYNGEDAIDNSIVTVVKTDPDASGNFETVVDNSSQGETIQLPAGNIFQTEDGLIFIQNGDGTTLQLQGSDGQALSIETVQALMGFGTESDSAHLIT